VPLLSSNPRLALELFSCIRGLDSVVRSCDQHDRAVAQIYSWTLSALAKDGTLGDIVDFYLKIQTYEADWVTAKLLVELNQILDLEHS
jgi:hypothetical protein